VHHSVTENGHIDFEKIDYGLVAGASGGIGAAIVQQILSRNKHAEVFATYRDQAKAKDLFDRKKMVFGDRLHLIKLEADKEKDYEDAAELIAERTARIDAVINCIGFLHGDSGKPEKRLADIELDHVRDSFAANSIPVVMLAKHLLAFFKNSSPAIFASLSARVGSIGDNRSGGWYSYRASKCAHNMFLKNIALEFERYRCNTLTLALHPGTTKTNLSLPYIAKTRYLLHSPEQTASNLLAVMSAKTIDSNGGFFDWEGAPVDW